MLKLIGILLISASFSAAGFVVSMMQTRALRAARDALHAVELLQSRIVHLLEPLPQAIETLAPQNPLLHRLYASNCTQSPNKIRAALKSANLSPVQIDVLMRLFQAIPHLCAGQTAPFDTAKEQLSLQIQQLQQTVPQRTALYPRLGLLAGLAAFLILI